MSDSLKNAPLYERIYAVVRQIPHGKVATYGQIAAIVGGRCQARTVGYALSALPFGHDVPWQRVINRLGKVSPHDGSENSPRQQSMLEAEGVYFDPLTDRTDLEKFGWSGPDWAWLEEHRFKLH